MIMANRSVAFKKLRKKRAILHINELFAQQQEMLISDISLAQRYTQMIRKIAMSLRIKLPRKIKRSYCKHCYSVFPATARVRLKNGKVVKYCEKCRNFTRIPYNKVK